jgi:hypothetical protein
MQSHAYGDFVTIWRPDSFSSKEWDEGLVSVSDFIQHKFKSSKQKCKFCLI